MKRFILLLTMLAVSSTIVFSQCTIYLKNGQKIAARYFFAPLKGDEIKYKTPDRQMLKVKKADVYVITRRKELNKLNENGFLVGGMMFKGMPAPDQKSVCVDGAMDALTYFKPSGTAIGTGIISFLAWPVGIITTAIVASVPPPAAKLNIPETANKNDNAYLDCYKKEPKKKKSSTAWRGCSFGMSMGILVEAIVMLATM